MHRVSKEMMGLWASKGPWDYQGLKGFLVPREMLVHLVLLVYLELQESPVRGESQGSQGSRARGGPSERLDSQGLRDPKVLLVVLEKMGPLDTRERQGGLETEGLKENVATLVFLEREVSRESEDAAVKLAHLDQWDLQAKRETLVLRDSWGTRPYWVIQDSWRS